MDIKIRGAEIKLGGLTPKPQSPPPQITLIFMPIIVIEIK